MGMGPSRLLGIGAAFAVVCCGVVMACGSDGTSGVVSDGGVEASSPDADHQADSGLPDAAPKRVCPPGNTNVGEAGAYRCGRFASDSNGDWGGSVAADLCGDFYTSESLFPASGTSIDTVIRKFDANCALQWTKHIGGSASSADVTVDPDGNLLVSGQFRGTITLGADTYDVPSPDDQHGYLAKLTPDGQWVFTKRFGSAGTVVAAGTAVADPFGNIVIGGGFTGSIDLGDGAKSNAGPTRDGYLAKLDPAGKVIFSKQYHVTNSCTTTGCGFIVGSISTGPTGEIAFGASLDGTGDFGGGSLTGHSKALVVKLAPDGTHRFSQAYGPDGLGLGTGYIKYDADGSLYLSGMLAVNNNVDFGNGVIAKSGTESNSGGGSWLVKLDANMVAQWARTTAPAVKADGINFITGIAVDPSKNVTIVGWFNGSIDLGDGPNTFTGYQSGAYFAKYLPDGGFVRKRLFEVTGATPTCNVYASVGGTNSLDQGGGAIITGTFSGTLDLGGGPQTAQPGWCAPDGGAQLFMAHYEP
jgi:hypothetical protein